MKLTTTVLLWILLLLWAAGCTDDPGSPGDPDPPDPAGTIPGVVPPDVTIDVRPEKINQLVGEFDNERQEPTQNQTYTRYRLEATDLGVPFEAGDRIWILFGDTWGEVPGVPNTLAWTTDTDPEEGLALEFIADESDLYRPIDIPGISQQAFEVPLDGVEIDGNIYIYHTTDSNLPQVTMGRSVVARAIDMESAAFEFLYSFSSDYFINVSVVKADNADWFRQGIGLPDDEGEGLVIFGSGRYRESHVYLAWQPASEIEDPGATRYFAGVDEDGVPLWSNSEPDALPLFGMDTPCVGELSVSYNPFIERWILLHNCDEPRGITLRTAEYPWGPWTEPQILFHPWDDGGYCHYIHVNWDFDNCDSVHDPGREYEWGGEYGPYQFENFAAGDNQSTTIYFTMSTWNPYTVVLMKARLRRD
jgi:hypothetical protein